MSHDEDPLDWDKIIPNFEVELDDLEQDDYGFLQNGIPFTGIAVSHYANGQLESRAPHLNGVPHGLCRRWHTNGTLDREWTVFRGMGHGYATAWFDSGQVASRRYSEFGRPLEWTKFDLHGNEVESGSNRADDFTRQWIDRCKKEFPEAG